jgi:hypothetical protein
MISNNGCEIDLKPEFIISHDSPIIDGAIMVEYYNSISSSWENIDYSIVDGDAVGYWGDLDGENVGCGSNQSRPVRVLFSQFNPSASLGTYTASLRLWKVNSNGDLLDVISEETSIVIELQDIICNNFEFNLTTQDASCGNQSDGQITLNSVGGLAPVQYGFNSLNFDSQNIFTGLQPDNYIVYGQDANGCQISDTVSLGPPILDPDTIWFTNINSSNALINWDFNNLVDGYRFRYRPVGENTWIGPVSSPGAYNDGVANPTTFKMIAGLMGGVSYEVQVKTNSLIDNCEEGWSTSHFFETPNESFVFDVSNTCYQSGTGFISLEFNAETIGYTFSWTDGISFSSTDTSIFNLVSGSYQLQLTNPSNTVILDTTFVISENIPESINFYVNGDSTLINQIGNQSFISICNAESFLQTQSGLTDYEWSNGYNGSTILLDTIPNNTILSLTASDQQGCILSSDNLYLTINTDFINFQQANTEGEIISNTNSFCSSDSSISFDISDYTSGNFSVDWSRIVNNNLIALGTEDSIVLMPTQSSSYLLEIYNCAYQFNINYLQSIPTTLDISNVLCFGDSSGGVVINVESNANEVFIEVSNSDLEVLYSELSSDFTDTIQSLSSGFYNIYISDTTAMCPFEYEFAVSEPDSLYIQTMELSDLSCFGDEYGSFMFNVVGGLPPFSFNLNGVSTNIIQNPDNGSFLLENLLPTSHMLEVIDANNCVDTIQISIEEPDSLFLEASDFTQNLICHGDTTAFIQLNVQGGNPSYNFELFNDDQALLFSQSDSLFSNLLANEYLALVTDINGCVDSLSITITQNDELIVEENEDQHQDISCNNVNDGQISLNISGGVMPYSATNSLTTLTSSPFLFDNLSPDSLNFIVTDNVGCSAELSSVILGLDSLIFDTLQINFIVCDEEFGSMDFLLLGNSTYTFELNGNSVTPIFQNDTIATLENLIVNQYEFVVFDEFGCSDTINFEMINQFINLDLEIISYSDTLQCFGDSTGFIELNAIGGLEPYVYSIVFEGDTLSTQTQGLFDSLVAGEYNIVVLDSNQCLETLELTIFQNEELIVSDSLEIHQNVLCVGGFGSFTLVANGGVPNYQLNVLGEPSFNYPHTYENVEAGLYEVIITDAVGCTSDIEVTIENPDTMFFESFEVQDVLCFGDSNGVLTFSTTGGVAPFYYMLNLDSLKPLDALSIGLYTLEVIDSNGCVIDSTFDVFQPPILTLGVDSDQTQNLICYDDDDGIISLSANGGVLPLQYQIDGGTLQDQNFFDNLQAGSYELTVVDENGCDTSLSYTLTQPLQDFVISNFSLSDTLGYCVLCYGDSSGTIDIEVSGGAYPFNYFINGSQDSSPTDSTFNNLVANQDYEFYVIDYLGCFSDTLTVNCNSTPEIEFAVSNQVAPLCCYSCDGQATINVSGGTQPFMYAHNGGAFQSSNLFDQTCSGLNQFEVIDFNGCQSQQLLPLATIECVEIDTFNYVNVNNPAVLNYDSCKTENSAYIYVQAVGGASPFKISFDAQDFIEGNQMFYGDLSSGEYDIVLVDNNLCLDTITVNIWQADPLHLDSLSIDSLFCAYPSVNSSTNISETGSFITSVSGGTPSLNGYQFSIDQIDSSSYSYNNSFNNLGSGIYSVNVLDEIGCSIEFEMELNGFSSSAQYLINEVSCPGLDDGTIELISATGTVDPWVEFDENLFIDSYIDGISAGEHILSTQFQYPNDNSMLCVNYDTIFFNETQSIEYELEVETINCYGDCSGSISINSVVGGTAPYTYACLTNGETGIFYDELCVGNYAVRVTDSLGCYETTIVSVNESNPIYPLISQNNGNLVVLEPTNDNPSSGTAPYTYQWYDQSGILTGETSETLTLSVVGRYYVIVTDNYGCEGISAEFNVEAVDINSFGSLEFNIFPNPVADYLYLEYLKDDIVLWTISDNLGRSILKGELNKSDEINVQSLNNGIYFLTFKKDNSEVIFKIIKE